MKNKQKGFASILIILLGLVVVGGGAYVYIQKENSDSPIVEDASSSEGEKISEKKDSIETPITTDTKTEPVIKAETKVETKTNTQVSLSDPWVVIDKIKAYSKARDQVGLNSLLYNQYPACGSKEECDFAFGFFDAMFETINKGGYTERWEDSKQIILASSVIKVDNTEEKSFTRNYLLFTKDSSGNIKFVGNSSSGLSYIKKNTNSTDAQMTTELELAVLDTDKDGLSDQEEKCEGASKYRGDCKVTDPSKRDTDGDGWWDGVEAKFE